MSAFDRLSRPGEDVRRIADGRRQPDSLDVAAAEPREPLENHRQVAAAVVADERVDLVDNHGLQRPEQPARGDLRAHQHDLERLRRGQQNVGRVLDKRLLLRRRHIAVPLERTASELGEKITMENRYIGFRDQAAKSSAAIADAIARLKETRRPSDEDALRFASLAAHRRLSKFQPCLTDRLEAIFLADELTDPTASRRALEGPLRLFG